MIKWLRSWFTPDVVFETRGDKSQYPTRGSKEAAGLDLYASEPFYIASGGTVLIKTGIVSKFNKGWVALLWDRSGMGFKGIHRFAGVIDSDYRGEWGVVLHNSTPNSIQINRGDRIAQVVFQRCWIGTPKRGKVDEETKRGSKGFGSTGK